MWLSGVHFAADFGGPPGFPQQGSHSPASADWGAVSWVSVDGLRFSFGLCAYWKERYVHLVGCPQPGPKPGSRVSAIPLKVPETDRGTPDSAGLCQKVEHELGVAKARAPPLTYSSV